MITPVRLTLSRANGFNLRQASLALNGLECVNAARPSDFGNPFITGQNGSAADCVRLFANLLAIGPAMIAKPSIAHQLERRTLILDNVETLRGKNIACWCKQGQPCHGKVLLKLANPKCDEVK